MSLSPRATAEREARNRVIIMNVARFGGIALVLIGIALTRRAPHLSPEWIFGAALAAMGVIEFFFLPAIVARRWKAGDRTRDNHRP